MVSAHRERELKFDVPLGFRMPTLTGLVGPDVRRRTVELRSTYYDTADHALLRSFLTLRRREGDEDTGWQLKVPAGEARTELSLPLDGTDAVPSRLRALLDGVVGDQPLRPVAIVRTHRSVTTLSQDGAVAAELADDLVSATALGDAAQASEWREVEAELVDGDEAVLDRVAKALRKAGAHPASSSSKVGRALADGAGEAPLPRGADALRRYLVEQARAVVAGDIALRQGEQPIHATRVGVRRIRSVLRVFADVLLAEATSFDEELRWYQGLLGEVRDRQVQRARLHEALCELPAELVLGPVAARIDQTLLAEEAAAAQTLRSALDSPRYRGVLATVTGWAHRPPIAPEHALELATVRKLTEAAQRTASKRLKRAAAADDAELLHRARKATKRARYATELVAAAGGKDAAAAGQKVERYKQLQDVLGAHQDAIVSQQLLRRLGAAAGSTPGENGFTFGVLYERERQAAAQARRRAADFA